MKTKKYMIYVSAVALVTVGILLLSWRRRAANVAESFLNVNEIGDNAGFDSTTFQSMMKSIGWQGGEAWCMYFAKAVYLNAFPKKSEWINKVLTGSTQTSWKNALNDTDHFKVITSGSPHVGDIVIWQYVSNPSLGHAGIVKKHLTGSAYDVVEGNTNLEGARDGQGVNVNERELVPGSVDGNLKLLGFIRIKL